MLDRTEIISCHVVKVSSNYNQSYWKRSRKCHKESNSLVVILDDRFLQTKTTHISDHVRSIAEESSRVEVYNVKS
jgi:hypothetical protein